MVWKSSKAQKNRLLFVNKQTGFYIKADCFLCLCPEGPDVSNDGKKVINVNIANPTPGNCRLYTLRSALACGLWLGLPSPLLKNDNDS